MPDSSAVDAALIAKLTSDATLTALMPDGVFYDYSPQGATRLVIVSQLAHEDAYQFQGHAWERFVYLVKAVDLDTSGSSAKSAADRIHTLLQDGTLTITGYELMNMHRLERVRYTEVDEDTDQRWQHRGGQYELLVTPA